MDQSSILIMTLRLNVSKLFVSKCSASRGFNNTILQANFCSFSSAEAVRSTSSLPIDHHNTVDNYGSNLINLYNKPGARVLKFQRSHSGNIVTPDLINVVMSKLKHYEDNNAVGAVLITPDNENIFSDGMKLDETTSSPEDKRNHVALSHDLAELIRKVGENTAVITVYSGSVKDTAFGVFADSTFRLGNTSTSFTMGGFLEAGRLPIGGCLLHRLAK